ncbi:MAG: UPF0182 family protein [Bryobacteraceae bacterium]
MADNPFPRFKFEPKDRPGTPRIPPHFIVIALLLALLISARSIASYTIEYQWWKELGQAETWLSMLGYAVIPVALATLVAFAVLWMAHARALKFAETRLSDYPTYAKLSAVGLFLVALIVASVSIDTWTVVRYAGARHIPIDAQTWRDSVFGLPLSFYLFELPFYSVLRGFALGLTIVAALVYWAAARGWQLRYRLPYLREATQIDPSILKLEGGLESRFLRGAAAVFLVGLAIKFFLGRYEMVWNDHGFMVGIDYVDRNIRLPLQWLVIAAMIAAAGFVLIGRWILAGAMAIALLAHAFVPQLVNALYVRPNEISLQRPYIETHIQATRNAFGLNQRLKETEFNAQQERRIDPAKHQHLLENVRLWDWRAFRDTVSQIQALRPYYVFPDSDVDRYWINGKYTQVLLSPRELDIRNLPDAQTSWINPHFIYTHGYGLVLAEVARITSDGLPVLLVQDAPPRVNVKEGLKITRPEIYYGEVVHEPVFVDTDQPEFNYPSGADNVLSRYEGTGGLPMSSFPMRLAAAVSEGQYNILLTSYFKEGSRMMIRRNVRDRLNTLAAFIQWDGDPYMVVTKDGRLVWIMDGYTTSSAHPYSKSLNLADIGAVNYMRNSVKATIDAYDGETRLYVFDESDPIILAYRGLFPKLFTPASEMPADLRAHARYPEAMFRVQAEMYRTYHMLDPQAFYNKEDVWDLARTMSAGQSGRPEPVAPTYIIATLPGETEPEFLLLTSFTPRGKDNLIGLMLARCDGEHLGELVVMQLSKQELIFGPMQIAARINQDQIIAKDLSLWNQQGSQVLRGQTLVLPIEDTFLYVEPIYIQATEARMPQMKKVVLAMGNSLFYSDTYDEALALLSGNAQSLARQAVAQAPPTETAAATPGAPAVPATTVDRRLERIRDHLRRYREMSSQGKWAEAGRELEAIETEAR